MPYEIKERDENFCVFKEGEESPVPGGCHDTRGQAEAHMAALYAAEEKGLFPEHIKAGLEVRPRGDKYCIFPRGGTSPLPGSCFNSRARANAYRGELLAQFGPSLRRVKSVSGFELPGFDEEGVISVSEEPVKSLEEKEGKMKVGAYGVRFARQGEGDIRG